MQAMPGFVVKKIKIMISSTRSDLAQYREKASEIIKKVAAEKERIVQLTEVSQEKETQSGDRESAVRVSKRWVEEAHWVVIIVGWNYGTISDEEGADGLSFTEWEYRHALKHGKKLFVFIAGNPEDSNKYRVSDEEKEDLKDWRRSRQTEEQIKKIEKFRQKLRKRHSQIFSNLPMFRERLETTLKNAIDALSNIDVPPLPIATATPLARLMVEMNPKIQYCIDKVMLIASCKQIHDLLHECLQHAIRPLREEVLSLWKQEGTLSRTREREIWNCMMRASGPIRGINSVRESFDPKILAKHKYLCRGVDRVKDCFGKWDKKFDSLGKFSESVDIFAEAVQAAFSTADRSMAEQESALGVRYVKLHHDLKRARKHWNLSSSEHQRLDSEIEKVEANRDRVKNSLTIHHRWQEIHDKLHELDSFREWNKFNRKLNNFCEDEATELLDLVGIELDQIDAHSSGNAGNDAEGVAPAVQQGSPKSPPNAYPACREYYGDLISLRENLETLRQERGTVAFDKMRKPFDDAFYCIDKKTLKEAQRANERAVELREWLDELAKRHLHAD